MKPASIDAQWWERASKVIPWGTQTNAKRRPAELADVMPGFLTRGEGCRVWDADGREYLDFDCSLGPVILGHGHPEVTAAARNQLEKGVLFPMANPLEIELAEQIRSLVPCAQRVRFLKTGADANSACIRMARAMTGREMIVTTSYHGWHDAFMTDQAGVPEAVRNLTVRCPFGDAQAVAAAFEKFPDRIAAVLTVPFHWADNPSREYLEALQKLAREHGALLIFDEVLTGFRLGLGGAQEYFGVVPDLASFAKAFANGFPLAAFVGRDEIMQQGLEKSIITTTYAGETLSLAAAQATLRVMQSQPVHKKIWAMGRKLMDGLAAIFRENGVPASVQGLPPHFYMQFKTGDPSRDQALGLRLSRELLRRGIFVRANRWFLSFSHGDHEIETTLEIMRKIFKETGAREFQST